MQAARCYEVTASHLGPKTLHLISRVDGSKKDLGESPIGPQEWVLKTTKARLQPSLSHGHTRLMMFTLQTSCLIIAQLNVDVLLDLRIQFSIITVIIAVWIMRTKP